MAFFKTFDLNRAKRTLAPQDPPTPSTVTIPVSEYDRLLQASAELGRLQAALQPAANETQGVKIAQPDLDVDGDLDDPDRFEVESLETMLDETKANMAPGSEEDLVAREHVNHTVILLPAARVTHAQVAAAVRGGALLQIYCQRFSNQVNVTFARSEDAAGFLAHAQSAPFYVCDHLTTVQWAPRGYIAPKYVFDQAHEGTVSRNLLLEAINPKVTEAMIRRDLHHIHNMAVISVEITNGKAYISTSSVGGALYARTCMRSRAFYKGMRISFYEDECAKSFPRTRRSRAAAPVKTPKKIQGLVYNPYEVLSQGELEIDQDRDEEDEEL